MKKYILLLLLLTTTSAMAEVGYVDYGVITKNLSASKQIQSQIDKKAGEIKTYIKTTKQQASSKTPEERDKIIAQRRAQLVKLENEYYTLNVKQQQLVESKVKTAAQIVITQKKLDAIINKKSVVAGGVDCTSDILKAIK